MYVNTRTPILLQTAKSLIYNPQLPQATANARIIFDSGSQRSYITNRVKDSLSLQTIQSETMLIKTLGLAVMGSKSGHQAKGRVMMLNYHFSQFHLSMSNQYEYLTNLDLADPPCDDWKLEVDILIGCDHYWKLVTKGSRARRSKEELQQLRQNWDGFCLSLYMS